MLTRLIERDIDADPQLRARLVGAFLIGGAVNTRAGQRTGGSFANVPTCAPPVRAGCVTAFSAFGRFPSRTALFGQLGILSNTFGGPPRGAGYEVACTDPAALAGDGDVLRPVLRSTLRPGSDGSLDRAFWAGLRPRATTMWVVPGDTYRSRCQAHEGRQALIVRATSPGSVQPLELPWSDWGFHIGEMSLTLGSLVRVAELQTQDWLAAHPGGVVAGPASS